MVDDDDASDLRRHGGYLRSGALPERNDVEGVAKSASDRLVAEIETWAREEPDVFGGCDLCGIALQGLRPLLFTAGAQRGRKVPDLVLRRGGEAFLEGGQKQGAGVTVVAIDRDRPQAGELAGRSGGEQRIQARLVFEASRASRQGLPRPRPAGPLAIGGTRRAP